MTMADAVVFDTDNVFVGRRVVVRGPYQKQDDCLVVSPEPFEKHGMTWATMGNMTDWVWRFSTNKAVKSGRPLGQVTALTSIIPDAIKAKRATCSAGAAVCEDDGDWGVEEAPKLKRTKKSWKGAGADKHEWLAIQVPCTPTAPTTDYSLNLLNCVKPVSMELTQANLIWFGNFVTQEIASGLPKPIAREERVTASTPNEGGMHFSPAKSAWVVRISGCDEARVRVPRRSSDGNVLGKEAYQALIKEKEAEALSLLQRLRADLLTTSTHTGNNEGLVVASPSKPTNTSSRR